MKTIDLIKKAEARPESIRALSVRLGMAPSALSVAKNTGRLSAGVAALLAADLGET